MPDAKGKAMYEFGSARRIVRKASTRVRVWNLFSNLDTKIAAACVHRVLGTHHAIPDLWPFSDLYVVASE